MPLGISFQPQPGAFPLVAEGKAATICYDDADARVVQLAVQAFQKDVQRITGIAPLPDSTCSVKPYSVITGTIGKSLLIDSLIRLKKINVSEMQGKWETFSIAVIDKPFPPIQQALVIAGSDPRGTAFGIFELSRMIGVPPFYWWADLALPHHHALYITKGIRISKPPSVQYRGIFINDEDWGLQPWSAKTFEPESGDIGPKTYAKVFELLLRLKANMIWPAMHPSTKPFFYFPQNKKVAEDYSIIIGSSHAEPMLRSNVGEWNKKIMGDFNYITNKQTVSKYWEDRVKETANNEVIYTMGMRGIHDSGMEGVKGAKEAGNLLESIFEDQRTMLKNQIHKNITAIPQAFTAYKEVLDIYDSGLKVPEDVSIVWPDDNYGYLQRLNDVKEQQRPGGSGVYYHASYWGRPHDYLWLSTTHPSLIREEMMKAFEMKSTKIWVLNVGDIKPAEYITEFFMDMAFDAAPFKDSKYSQQHLHHWATKLFGKENGKVIAPILWGYYQLAFERKPEFMGWSQTEPTTKNAFTAYNHFYYGDEAQQRIDQYGALEKKVQTLWRQMDPRYKDPFYELVYYPVVCASLMNKKFLYRDKSYLYAKQNRLSAADYALWGKQAYDSIVKETAYYNHQLAGGKWKNIMTMNPRNLPVFQETGSPEINIDRSEKWNVIPEGWATKDASLFSKADVLALPNFDNRNRQKYFIDIFLQDDQPVRWTATPSQSWIHLSTNNGFLNNEVGRKQMRLWVDLDWKKIKTGNSSGKITFTGEGKQVVVSIHASNENTKDLMHYKGFIENNGYVSLYAAHFTRKINKQGSSWQVLQDIGHTGQSVQALPLYHTTIAAIHETTAIKSNNACLEYDFYTTASAAPVITVISLPTHPLNNNYSMRYAIAVDDDPLKIVDFRTYGRSETWKQNVLSNTAIHNIEMPRIGKGKHSLKIYAIDPGVILDRILINLGGLQKVYSIIPETKM